MENIVKLIHPATMINPSIFRGRNTLGSFLGKANDEGERLAKGRGLVDSDRIENGKVKNDFKTYVHSFKGSLFELQSEHFFKKYGHLPLIQVSGYRPHPDPERIDGDGNPFPLVDAGVDATLAKCANGLSGVVQCKAYRADIELSDDNSGICSFLIRGGNSFKNNGFNVDRHFEYPDEGIPERTGKANFYIYTSSKGLQYRTKEYYCENCIVINGEYIRYHINNIKPYWSNFYNCWAEAREKAMNISNISDEIARL